MKSLIFLVAAVVLAVCFYLFAPLSFIHGSGFVAKVVYGALFVIPTIMAINPITNSAAEGSFLNKYGIGIAAIGAVLISIFTFGQIKDSKTDAAITKNGARTIAILKDAHKETKKSRKGGSSTTCEVTLAYTANGKAIETKTEMLESDYDQLLGIGQPLPIVYVKDTPDVVLVMLSEPNKSKYATVPMDVQPETAPPAGN